MHPTAATVQNLFCPSLAPEGLSKAEELKPEPAAKPPGVFHPPTCWRAAASLQSRFQSHLAFCGALSHRGSLFM